jgi:hypothetical protein
MTFLLDGREITRTQLMALSTEGRLRAKQRLEDGTLIRAIPPAGTDWSEDILPPRV